MGALARPAPCTPPWTERDLVKKVMVATKVEPLQLSSWSNSRRDPRRRFLGDGVNRTGGEDCRNQEHRTHFQPCLELNVVGVLTIEHL